MPKQDTKDHVKGTLVGMSKHSRYSAVGNTNMTVVYLSLKYNNFVGIKLFQKVHYATCFFPSDSLWKLL